MVVDGLRARGGDAHGRLREVLGKEGRRQSLNVPLRLVRCKVIASPYGLC